jgi:hypothetical protein
MVSSQNEEIEEAGNDFGRRMRMKFLPCVNVSGLIQVCLMLLCGISCAQQTAPVGEMDHAKPAILSTELTIRGLDGKTVNLTSADLAVLQHKTISVYNEHTKANETYSGVALTELLKKVNTPAGEAVRGKLFMTGIVAEGTDHYSVLYALAEVDPSIHTGDVIVADSANGHPLDKDGAFKLVSTEEKRPARWVRNLTRIAVVAVQP